MPVKSTSTIVSWLRTPMTFRISFGDLSKSKPATWTWPDVFLRSVVRTFMVVLFPAPFGPRKPKNSPSLTSNDMLSTAFVPSL
jgi:hypothetical protein